MDFKKFLFSLMLSVGLASNMHTSDEDKLPLRIAFNFIGGSCEDPQGLDDFLRNNLTPSDDINELRNNEYINKPTIWEYARKHNSCPAIFNILKKYGYKLRFQDVLFDLENEEKHARNALEDEEAPSKRDVFKNSDAALRQSMYSNFEEFLTTLKNEENKLFRLNLENQEKQARNILEGKERDILKNMLEDEETSLRQSIYSNFEKNLEALKKQELITKVEDADACFICLASVKDLIQDGIPVFATTCCKDKYVCQEDYNRLQSATSCPCCRHPGFTAKRI